MKTLSVIESAYRATIEEQDDTVVWMNHAMRAAGADLSVLLRGNAVNYAVRHQDASGLSFGAKKQTQPPRVVDDVKALIGKGVDVYFIEDDLADRGLEHGELVEGLKPLKREELPHLFGQFGRVWFW